jgi:hypothetical protein
VKLFTHMASEDYACLEALPSLVDHMLSYAGCAPEDRAPRLNLGVEELWFADRLDIACLPRPVVAICADDSDRYRGWPVERYRAIAQHVRRRGATLLELGVHRRLGIGIDMVGAVPIRGSAAILSRCDLFIGNSSSLLHYAQAADVPAIGVFSLALPERFVHDDRLVVGVQHETLPCIDCVTRDFVAWHRSQCGHSPPAACMLELRVDLVRAAVDRVFDHYLADCPVRGQEGPRARAFRAEVYRHQAQRLLARGHVARAERFLRFADQRLGQESGSSLAACLPAR